MANKPFVTVFKNGNKHRPVLLGWDEDLELFIPWNAGYHGHVDKKSAEKEAKVWASDENIRFIRV